jgi:hypothetical protein
VSSIICLKLGSQWTEVTEISPVPESLPRYAYKLRSFQSLLASTGDKTYLAGNFLCACCFLVLSGFFHFCSCSMVCLLMQRCLCDFRCGRHCYWCICRCYNHSFKNQTGPAVQPVKTRTIASTGFLSASDRVRRHDELNPTNRRLNRRLYKRNRPSGRTG